MIFSFLYVIFKKYVPTFSFNCKTSMGQPFSKHNPEGKSNITPGQGCPCWGYLVFKNKAERP